MDDARHEVESSTETPEGGGAPTPCQSKKKMSKPLEQFNEIILAITTTYAWEEVLKSCEERQFCSIIYAS